MNDLHTARLQLVPLDAPLSRAALAGSETLAPLIGARVPSDWPLPDLAEFLPELARMLENDPAGAGWAAWLLIDAQAGEVVGDAGFQGPPDGAGVVEIGYSVLPAWRGRGYATEAAAALVALALRQPNVRRVVAECDPENAPSIRVLERIGMRQVSGDGAALRWEITH